jgi:DNA-directed RNA polymerase specialized sigma54-like protein
MTARQIIADFIWNEIDKMDLDDMGSSCAQQIIDRLSDGGYVIIKDRIDPEGGIPGRS